MAPCAACKSWKEATDLRTLYVIRTCKKCGRKVTMRPLGEHGIGVKIEKGDQVVMPKEALRMSANPLLSTGRFTTYGLSHYAKMVFGVDIANPTSRDGFDTALAKILDETEKTFVNIDFFQGLDLEDQINEAEITRRLEDNKEKATWWAFMSGVMYSICQDAIKDGDAGRAAWAMCTAERFRALSVFKGHFEEAVFMGHSAKPVIDLMRIWDANKENSDEGFWQHIFTDHAYALGQIFSVQAMLIKGRAYVGGMALTGKDARFLDFLLAGGNANDAILLEIKAPTTKLLGRKYRSNAYSASHDLSGAVIQLNDYCNELQRNMQAHKSTGVDLNAFNPRRVVLIGNYEKEIGDPAKRSSLDIFRRSLSGVEIVTFDELFKKIEHLARLFNLSRSAPPTPIPTLQPASSHIASTQAPVAAAKAVKAQAVKKTRMKGSKNQPRTRGAKQVRGAPTRGAAR